MNAYILGEALRNEGLRESLDSATENILDRFEADLVGLEKDVDFESGFTVEEYLNSLEQLSEISDLFMLDGNYGLTERLDEARLRGLKWLDDLAESRRR